VKPCFWGAADLIAEGDNVVGRWKGDGTHTGPAFNDFLIGSLRAATGRKMHFTGTTVLRLKDGKIVGSGPKLSRGWGGRFTLKLAASLAKLRTSA
jgi:predicted ester cyclase